MRFRPIAIIALIFACLALCPVVRADDSDPLAAGFKNPPASAKPHTWWHMMDGNITREGITADLEAMKRAGIGGAQSFTVALGIPKGPADYNSPLWHQLMVWAAKEAKRLGLDFCIHNCAGWSSSGGPWITPENGMQVIAWSSAAVHGPAHVSIDMPQPKPPAVARAYPYYRDIAVFAFRTPAAAPAAVNDLFLGLTGVVGTALTVCRPVPCVW